MKEAVLLFTGRPGAGRRKLCWLLLTLPVIHLETRSGDEGSLLFAGRSRAAMKEACYSLGDQERR